MRYLRQTGRSEEQIDLVERYTKAQGLWRDVEPVFQTTSSSSSWAPWNRRWRDRRGRKASWRYATRRNASAPLSRVRERVTLRRRRPAPMRGPLPHGDIAIASIASCTNTANPYQIIAAGLLARNAITKGLCAKPWVKTSFSPGSRVVPAMLTKAGLTEGLDALGFHLVGFGCMSCGSGSGALAEDVAAEVAARGLVMAGVISSNRNFDGRLNASVRGTFLASPPLVVAYAIAGSILHDLTRQELGYGADGQPVFLADLWPDDAEIRAALDLRSLETCSTTLTTISPIPERNGAEIPHALGRRYSPGIPAACTSAARPSLT